MPNVEALLATPTHVTRLVALFRGASAASMRGITGPFVVVMSKSPELTRQLGCSGLFVSCLVRRLGERSEAFLLRSYLRMLGLVHEHHPNPRNLVLNFNIYDKLRGLSESTRAAQQVVLFQKTQQLLRSMQITTLS